MRYIGPPAPCDTHCAARPQTQAMVLAGSNTPGTVDQPTVIYATYAERVDSRDCCPSFGELTRSSVWDSRVMQSQPVELIADVRSGVCNVSRARVSELHHFRYSAAPACAMNCSDDSCGRRHVGRTISSSLLLRVWVSPCVKVAKNG